MTFYELKEKMIKAAPNTHFFDEDTLKFFGERYSSFRVLKKMQVIKDYGGMEHSCYVLAVTRSIYGFQRVKPYAYYHYIDSATFHAITEC